MGRSCSRSCSTRPRRPRSNCWSSRPITASRFRPGRTTTRSFARRTWGLTRPTSTSHRRALRWGPAQHRHLWQARWGQRSKIWPQPTPLCQGSCFLESRYPPITGTYIVQVGDTLLDIALREPKPDVAAVAAAVDKIVDPLVPGRADPRAFRLGISSTNRSSRRHRVPAVAHRSRSRRDRERGRGCPCRAGDTFDAAPGPIQPVDVSACGLPMAFERVHTACLSRGPGSQAATSA